MSERKFGMHTNTLANTRRVLEVVQKYGSQGIGHRRLVILMMQEYDIRYMQANRYIRQALKYFPTQLEQRGQTVFYIEIKSTPPAG